MDAQQTKKREKEEGEEEKTKHEGKETQATKQQQQQQQKQKAHTIAPASPPSSSSSPSHEFSFTISLHSSSNMAVPDKTTKSPPSYAIDLSPADEIFFHGHLLPLHLLSHLPISPRSSTNSLDSFTLPVLEERRQNNNDDNNNKNKSNNINSNTNNNKRKSNKVKSFTLFSRWRKGCEVGGEREIKQEDEDMMKKKRKVRFNVSHILKRYIRIIRPLLVFRGRRDKGQLRRQPFSFSGNLAWKGKQELRGRRGEYSAPASMWNSPTNSGPLSATPPYPSSKNDSSMEELQSAIQAAIAHCKNSIAIKEEKIKC